MPRRHEAFPDSPNNYARMTPIGRTQRLGCSGEFAHLDMSASSTARNNQKRGQINRIS